MSSSPSPDSDTALGTLSALMLGLSGVVLIIACLNVANMLLARGAARAKELAVRLALGARRSRIVRQLLTEGILLALAGAALGLLCSYWATHALAASLSAAFPVTVAFSIAPDIRVLAATLGFAALSTIAFGLGPALRLSRRDLVADLKDRGGDGASTGRRFGARNLMVIGQVALSLALLTAGGIFAHASPRAPAIRHSRSLLLASPRRFAKTRAVHVGEARDRSRRRDWRHASMPFGDTQQSAAMERLAYRDRSRSGPDLPRHRADHFAARAGVVRGRSSRARKRVGRRLAWPLLTGAGEAPLRGRGPDRPDDPRCAAPGT
jgi:hypothetical protein